MTAGDHWRSSDDFWSASDDRLKTSDDFWPILTTSRRFSGKISVNQCESVIKCFLENNLR
jgi:hypothetical protein